MFDLNDPLDSATQLEALAAIQKTPWVENWMVLAFLFWVVAYVVVLARGYKDKSCGMPLAALAANFAWEMMWGWIVPDKPPMDTINRIWGFVDVLIILQFLRYGPRRLPKHLPSWAFVPGTLMVFALAFGIVILGSYEFTDWVYGGAYFGYGINIMMSGLFIGWVLSRDDVDGQSIWVGICKGLGTVAMSFAQGPLNEVVTGGSPFLTFMFYACALLDFVYVALLWRRMRALGIANPLRRL